MLWSYENTFVHKENKIEFIQFSSNIQVFCALLSMQGQKALGFHQKYPICFVKMNRGLLGLERCEGE